MKDVQVAIIGGGINGVGIARELALRGVSVALFEKGDLASGTSSASSKLAHGGIRYLEQGNFKLVFEALHERNALLKNAPHLVKPLPFVLPIYKEMGRPAWMVKVGLTLYDLLAGKQDMPTHQPLSVQEVLNIEPDLSAQGLLGGALYWDAAMDDARLVIEAARDAHQLGAAIHTYTAIVSAKPHLERIQLHTQETLTGASDSILAKIVINATGPCVQALHHQLGIKSKTLLRPSKGVHIIVPHFTHSQHAFLMTDKRTHRVFFVLPWHQYVMIGTTDTDYTDSIDSLSVNKEEIDYLLQETNRYFPKAALQSSDVRASFAGLRPLIRGHSAMPGAVSRDFKLTWELPNWISVIGGKYTTFRALSEQVAKQVLSRLEPQTPFKKGLTLSRPFYGGRISDPHAFLTTLSQVPPVSKEVLLRLIQTYGTAVTEVLDCCFNTANGFESFDKTEYLQGEVTHGIQNEWVKTPEDFIRRRTRLFFENKQSEFRK